MSGSVTKCILVGFLGKDPEVRRMGSGEQVVNLCIATSETWKDRNSGERKERTEWHSVVIYNEHHAKVAEQYLRKGAKVYVEGSLQTRKWQDACGVEKYSTEIVLQKFRGELTLLDSAEKGERSEPAPSRQPSNGYAAQRGEPKRDTRQDLDDDIPW